MHRKRDECAHRRREMNRAVMGRTRLALARGAKQAQHRGTVAPRLWARSSYENLIMAGSGRARAGGDEASPTRQIVHRFWAKANPPDSIGRGPKAVHEGVRRSACWRCGGENPAESSVVTPSARRLDEGADGARACEGRGRRGGKSRRTASTRWIVRSVSIEQDGPVANTGLGARSAQG